MSDPTDLWVTFLFQIMTDMLVKHCIVPMQKPMLEELAVAPSKLKIKLWMKTKELIQVQGWLMTISTKGVAIAQV